MTSLVVLSGVHESRILIGRDCLADGIRQLTAGADLGSVAVVTSPPVRRRYAAAIQSGLKRAGITPLVLSVPDGERAKSLRWAAHLYDRLIRARFERGSTLIALGGGVIGDLTGFVASTYLRGVSVVHVPTTLVAQVDASIGGKTGINHPKGKNLIGTFYQPRLVLIDVAMLRTLPKREFVGGLAEVVKYGVIADPELFAFLEEQSAALLNLDPETLEHVVARSAGIKVDVVGKDEREAGLRRILNYGHTLGHAIETVSGYGRLHHGAAIAIGMEFAARLAVRLGRCETGLADRQRQLLTRLGLPSALPPRVSVRSLLSTMALDKKVRNGRVHFVLPERIGRVVVEPVDWAVVKAMLADFARRIGGR